MSPRELREAAEAEALRMWPERLHLRMWDGALLQVDIDRRLLIQRHAFEMGAKWAAERLRAQEPVEEEP